MSCHQLLRRGHHGFHGREPVDPLLTGTCWHNFQHLECVCRLTGPYESVEARDTGGNCAKFDKQSALRSMAILSQICVHCLWAPLVGYGIFGTWYILCLTNAIEAWCIKDSDLIEASFIETIGPAVWPLVWTPVKGFIEALYGIGWSLIVFARQPSQSNLRYISLTGWSSPTSGKPFGFFLQREYRISCSILYSYTS